MRLHLDRSKRLAVIGLSLVLAACGRGGSDLAELNAGMAGPSAERSGPAADYPVVLGDPFTVDGKEYTPFDTMNYDQVGYVTVDGEAGSGVTAAHKTLPLPSYVEVTALDSGKTTLVRVERRGPMTSNRLLALSPAANAQLGIGDGAAIRVRRVNPPETERAMLRTGAAAPERIDTPKSLLAVLKRKLPANGSVSLAANNSDTPLAAVAPSKTPQPVTIARSVGPVAVPTPTGASFEQAFTEQRRAVTAYPLAPIGKAAAAQPARVTRNAVPAAVTLARTAPTVDAADDGKFVVQAAAFSKQANASKAADTVGGFVEQSGRYYRVRIGPFGNRGQAEAALAKARAAGYSDARVYTTG